MEERYGHNQSRPGLRAHQTSGVSQKSVPLAGGTSSTANQLKASNGNGFFPDKPSLSIKMLIISLLAASIAITIALAANLVKSFDNDNSNSSFVKTGQYQAVFLDNGQVYFGKLYGVQDEYVQLTDIYYLQVDKQVQPEQKKEGEESTAADTSADASGDTGEQQQQISLAKLGKELHGPEDVMYIKNSKIVFWENLKDDGQVVSAIKEYQNSQN